MTSYQPMAMKLETERLTMRSWAETDADDYCALVAERDDGVLTVEADRERIANQLAAWLRDGGGARGARRGDRDWAEAIVVNGGGMEHTPRCVCLRSWASNGTMSHRTTAREKWSG